MKFVDDSMIPDDPHPELRAVLGRFATEITAVLKENLVGIYLVGSLASGDFDLDSDVDFLVVINAELNAAEMHALQEIQTRIYALDCYPAKHLEGSYISVSELNNWDNVGNTKLFYFDNGSTVHELSTHDNQWHVRWILRERGITLTGLKPVAILKAIPVRALKAEMRTALLRNFEIFQAEMSRPLSFFNSRFGQSFFVLTTCRALHTLHTGTVQSKKVGMLWAKQFVDPKWIELIDQAWVEREGVRFGIKVEQRAETARLDETLDFMQYAVARMDDFDLQAG